MKPSSAETTPSCMWPPRVSVGSSQWTATRRPATGLYCSARRIRPGETTGRPSSVNPAAPASASSPISVSSAPACPFEIAAMKPSGTSASARALSTSDARTDAESTTGSVFGIARIAQ